jgi:hypothetical protein
LKAEDNASMQDVAEKAISDFLNKNNISTIDRNNKDNRDKKTQDVVEMMIL